MDELNPLKSLLYITFITELKDILKEEGVLISESKHFY